MRQHFLSLPPKPSSLRAHLSPDIDAVHVRALAKEPEGRFPSVSAFVHERETSAQLNALLFETI